MKLLKHMKINGKIGKEKEKRYEEEPNGKFGTKVP